MCKKNQALSVKQKRRRDNRSIATICCLSRRKSISSSSNARRVLKDQSVGRLDSLCEIHWLNKCGVRRRAHEEHMKDRLKGCLQQQGAKKKSKKKDEVLKVGVEPTTLACPLRKKVLVPRSNQLSYSSWFFKNFSLNRDSSERPLRGTLANDIECVVSMSF